MSLSKPETKKKVIPWGDHVVNGRNRPTVASPMFRKPFLKVPSTVTKANAS